MYLWTEYLEGQKPENINIDWLIIVSRLASTISVIFGTSEKLNNIW